MTELVINRLWTDQQPMSFLGLPVGRRSAVVRSDDGRLVVFSPLEATPTVVTALRSRGEVAAFVVSSRFHDRFYEGYFAHFPEARFFASRAVMRDHADWPLTEITSNAAELTSTRFLTLEGMPRVQEQVFLHPASGTLIVADALFNVPQPKRWSTGLLMRAAEIGGAVPRPCRLFRMLIQDRRALAGSVKRILEWDFTRIVPGHGNVVEQDAKSVLKTAYRRYLT